MLHCLTGGVILKNSKRKNICKSIAAKLPIFLFCILFIQSYSGIFGSENKIISVVVLTGILVFLQKDFDFNVKQAAISIPVLFAVIAFMPKFSLINPFLGFFLNLFSIGFILIVTCHNLSYDNHVTFLLGYIFCQGYEVSGTDYIFRIGALMIGSLIIASLYYLIHRKKQYTRNLTDLFKAMNLNSENTQWYLKLAITLSLVMFVTQLIHFPRSMWISLSILSLIQPESDRHVERRRARIPATLIGTLSFFLLFQCMIPIQYQSIVTLLIGFGTMFVSSYFLKTALCTFNAIMPAMLLFSAKEAIILRITANIIGVIIAIAATYLFDLLFDTINRKRDPDALNIS